MITMKEAAEAINGCGTWELEEGREGLLRAIEAARLVGAIRWDDCGGT